MSLETILEKSRKYPPEVVVKKAVCKGFTLTQDYLEYLKDIIFGTELSDDELHKKLLSAKIKEIYFGLSWQPLLNEEIKNKMIEEADKAKNHIVNLLGSGDVKVDHKLRAKGLEGYRYDMRVSDEKYLSIKEKIQNELEKIFQKFVEYEPINWQVDFKSGYRWLEKTYYKFIKYGHKLGVDIKLPWELSRGQHLLSLGLAYRFTKKREYAEEIIKQIVDWVLANPYKFGVNWRCTMEVAIRVANWAVSIGLIKDYIDNLPLTGKEYFRKIFLKSLYQHGDFTTHNLEWSDTLTSNHYLSNIAGLLILAIFTEDIFKKVKKWKNFAVRELKKEIFKQVYPDGVDYEASTCYHRLILELFFYATVLVIINDENFKEDNFIEVGKEIFGEEYIQLLYKMFEFVLYALKPNGRMPQIGDNDSGRLFIFTKREILDMRYLLTLGAIFFNESKFKIKEFGFCEEALSVFGEKGYKIWQDLKENSLVNIGSQSFPNAGWYIMRNDKNYMFISSGPNGQNGNGGHSHNDKLSFELCIEGVTFIQDPGTYVYTPYPEMRNLFRSTAYHNIVMVDKKEQNRFNKNELFRMRNDVNIRVNKWEANRDYDFFSGEYKRNKGSRDNIIHRRDIYFDKKENYWIIKDIVKGEDLHQSDLYFHITPLKVELDKEFDLTVKIKGKKINLAIIPLEKEGISVDMLEGWISPYYGLKVRAPVIKYSKKDYFPFSFSTLLYPYKEKVKIGEVVEKVESLRQDILRR